MGSENRGLSLDEANQSAELVKNRLQNILLEIGDYILSRHDRTFIDILIENINSPIEDDISDLIGLINNDNISEMRKEAAKGFRPCKLDENEEKVLSRIIEHADYFKNEKKVGYKINDSFFSTEEVKNIILDLMEGPINRFVEGGKGASCQDYIKRKTDSSKKFLNYLLVLIDADYRLSAEKIIDLETNINEYNKLIAEEKYRIYSPFENNSQRTYVRIIVNYALGRGWPNLSAIREEDIFRFKEKHTDKDGLIDLTSLSKEIRKIIPEKRKISGEYDQTLKKLKKYIGLIDPSQHELHGLYWVVPKNIKTSQ